MGAQVQAASVVKVPDVVIPDIPVPDGPVLQEGSTLDRLIHMHRSDWGKLGPVLGVMVGAVLLVFATGLLVGSRYRRRLAGGSQTSGHVALVSGTHSNNDHYGTFKVVYKSIVRCAMRCRPSRRVWLTKPNRREVSCTGVCVVLPVKWIYLPQP